MSQSERYFSKLNVTILKWLKQFEIIFLYLIFILFLHYFCYTQIYKCYTRYIQDSFRMALFTFLFFGCLSFQFVLVAFNLKDTLLLFFHAISFI